jgi:hypothetical protein
MASAHPVTRLCHRSVPLIVGVAIACGTALRLAFPDDIEWKLDERWSIDNGAALAAGGPWQWLGMPSSVSTPNPGLSLWVFAALIRLTGSASPPAIGAVIATMNSLAIVLFVILAWRLVAAPERPAWYWAAALWAVNPLAIIFERKIWPPSVLPLPFVIWLGLWFYRRHPLGAFCCGVLGALMTQIHMGVVFLVLPLMLWSYVLDRSSVRLLPFACGFAIGLLPALPWLLAMGQGSGGFHKLRFPILTFYLRWLTQPFGLGAEYTLGNVHGRDFLKWPVLAGRATYLVAIAHVIAAGVALAAAWSVVSSLVRSRLEIDYLGRRSAAVQLIAVTFFLYGGVLTLLTVIGAGSHRHYMIYVAPVMALWVPVALSRAGWSPRTLHAVLLLSCVAQALIAASLLGFIHETQVLNSEYGATWRSQQAGSR